MLEYEPNHFMSIIEKTQLSKILNDCLERPPAHAAPYWEKLQDVINHQEVNDTITDGEGVFLIKYLLADTFGCVVPVFIDFKYELEPWGDSNKRFKRIEFYKNVDQKLEIIDLTEEVHSGW